MTTILDRPRPAYLDRTFGSIETNGIRLRAAVQGQGPLIVMIHGFPESWYSWRHQMLPFAAAGFTACAIDVRGYGGSDRPRDASDYDAQTITADIAGVIDALSPGAPAILIGHDWGAPLAWDTALLYPDRVRAVAGLAVPYLGHGKTPFVDIMREIFTKRGKFFYQVYFQDEGVAEAEFEADVRSALRRMYFAGAGEGLGSWTPDKPADSKMLEGLPDPQPFPAWLTEDDIDYYVDEFERSGFRGPLNRYRNFERDTAFFAQRADNVLHQPALFIAGERDLALNLIPGADLVAMMKRNMSDLRGVHILPGIGHWTQQEAPEETTCLLIDWLATL
ncbi:MAG: alpha/beta hydrolase [Caulobacterales bacterium]